jgi:hypothetical protein
VSIFRKIQLTLLFIVVAGISSWLRFGSMDSLKQWLASRPAPRVESPAATPQEDSLPVHVSYFGTGSSPRESVMVLHFRRQDAMEETMAKASVRVLDANNVVQREVSVWGVFRHDPSLSASIARFTVGNLPPGGYRVEVDVGSRQSLGVKRAAIEFASREADSIWSDLAKAR